MKILCYFSWIFREAADAYMYKLQKQRKVKPVTSQTKTGVCVKSWFSIGFYRFPLYDNLCKKFYYYYRCSILTGIVLEGTFVYKQTFCVFRRLNLIFCIASNHADGPLHISQRNCFNDAHSDHICIKIEGFLKFLIFTIASVYV